MLRVWVLPALALTCAVSWGVIRLATRAPVRRAAIEALFAGYMGVLLYVVFLQLPLRPDATRFVWSSVNLVPTRTVVGIIRDFPGLVIQQLLGDVVLFLLLLSLMSRRSVDVDDGILNVTGACLSYLAWRGAHRWCGQTV